jgi:hypothetical protein
MIQTRSGLDVPTYDLEFPGAGIGLTGQCHWTRAARDGVEPRGERGYEFDYDGVFRGIGRPITADVADLLEVAFATYVADRLSPRRAVGSSNSDLGWQREFYLKIPVRDCDRWNSPPLQQGLQSFLARLTEDVWNLDFYARRSSRDDLESQLPLIDPLSSDDNLVCLFSGGLDSFAGAVDLLHHNERRNLICVGGTTNGRIGFAQSELCGILDRKFRDRATLVRVKVHLTTDPEGWAEEATQRSRGFFHLSIGAAVAAAIGSSTLHVSENGIGAINLPYTSAQLGTHMTRSMHPSILVDAAKWFTEYFGREIGIVNGMLGLTKAQACRKVAKSGLDSAIPASFSCDGFQRVSGRPQCGVCTSCLLRRQALHASGLGSQDDPTRYCLDVTDPNAEIPRERLVGLRLMRDQVATLRRCLDQPDPWVAIIDEFPALAELTDCGTDWHNAGGTGLPSRDIPALYRTYVDEWEKFPVSERYC